MDIMTLSLADLGRFVASRTANTDAAMIAHSSAPQLRYDAVIGNILSDPQQRDYFSRDEWQAMIRRIDNEGKRLGAWHKWGLLYGDKPSFDDLEEWEAEGGCEAVDGCWVESDGVCPHGCPSWLLVLGMI